MDDELTSQVPHIQNLSSSQQVKASLDETHRLAIIHPQYDGFLALYVTALSDLDETTLQPDETLSRIVTPHHAVGPLYKGQVRPIDLELHPLAIPNDQPISGYIKILDKTGEEISPPFRLTLATDIKSSCTIAGSIDGPWSSSTEFEQVIHEFLSGKGSAHILARRITFLEAGRVDPGWKKRWWKARR